MQQHNRFTAAPLPFASFPHSLGKANTKSTKPLPGSISYFSVGVVAGAAAAMSRTLFLLVVSILGIVHSYSGM